MLLAVVSDPTKLRFITRGEFMQRIKKDQPRSMTVSEADKQNVFGCLPKNPKESQDQVPD
jgi:hypothetical protein